MYKKPNDFNWIHNNNCVVVCSEIMTSFSFYCLCPHKLLYTLYTPTVVPIVFAI